MEQVVSFLFKYREALFSKSQFGFGARPSVLLILAFIAGIGALIYIIVRGRSMAERQAAAIAQQQAAQEQYIHQVAGRTASPAEQINEAKALLDSGAIDRSEFDSLKAHALAAA